MLRTLLQSLAYFAVLNITYVQLNLTVLISFELRQNLPDRQLCKYVSVFKIRSTLPHMEPLVQKGY